MNKKHQSGMTIWGLSIIIIVVVINAFMAIKIGPIYMDNLTVIRIMESMREPLQKERLPKKKIWSSMWKKMIVNNIRGIGSDTTVITQTSSKTKIVMNYEVRRTLLYNLDFVVKFNNEMIVRRGGK